MNKYVIKFTKQGYIRYTSHLDMLRLFKRTFKKCGIDMAYSKGFNPHPKMGFAQPLSLGYTSSCEYLELETKEHYEPKEIMERIVKYMPEGVELLSCTVFPRERNLLRLLHVKRNIRLFFLLPTILKNTRRFFPGISLRRE